jgi:hypothetical protein
MDGGVELLEIELLEPGLREVGVWPNDPYQEFVETLQGAIARESDPERRGLLQRMLAISGEVGQSVLTSLLTASVKQTVGVV